MSGIEITRRELTAVELRAAAGKSRDATAARRLLALALVLEGVDRTRAAGTCGMDRQTLRGEEGQETVRGTVSPTNGHRTNAEGLAGLSDRWKGVRVPRLARGPDGGPRGLRSRPGRTLRGTGWCAGAGRICSAGLPRPSGSRCMNARLASIWRRSVITDSRCARSTRKPTRTRKRRSKKLPRGGRGGDPRGRARQTPRNLVPRVSRTRKPSGGRFSRRTRALANREPSPASGPDAAPAPARPAIRAINGLRPLSRTGGGRGLTVRHRLPRAELRRLPRARSCGGAGPARRQHRSDECPPGGNFPARVAPFVGEMIPRIIS